MMGRKSTKSQVGDKYEVRVNKKNKKLSNVKFIDSPYGDYRLLDESYKQKLDTDIKYSLAVDPLNYYNLTEREINFVSAYVQLHNYEAIQFYTGITVDECKECHKNFGVQQEINRINMAMTCRRLNQKHLNADELGGYVTSMITDENVPLADRLSSKDKLKAIQLLIELNKFKQETYNNPKLLNDVEIEEDIEELDVSDIKKLLNSKKEKTEEKENLINEINSDDHLSMEEISNLKGMSMKELTELRDKINKAKENENDEQSF